ncbi:PEP-CTERM sorting domain-containing protein [Lacipirellula sp.]|uniref:PEP-CTERM sorting domain-containing protein n=1 Tax=Lacipirellula sp. TaxID=2691419 RepID=UPI003D0F1460
MSVEHASSSAAALRRRTGYALAATVAAAGSGTDAEGAVVYSGLQEISIAQGNRQALRFNDDAYNDIVLKNYIFAAGNYQGGTIPFSPGAVSGFTANLFNYATALNAGEVIDQSTLGGFAFSLALGSANPNAQFINAENKYIGLAFPIGPTDLYYAWIRVSINNAAGTFIVHDWAWQNETGVPITAGAGGLGDFNVDGVVNGADFLVWQRSFGDPYDAADLADWKSAYGNGVAAAPTVAAVPEPGALGLLAAGAGGLEILRRRHGRRKSS